MSEKKKKDDKDKWDSYVGFQVLAHHKHDKYYLTLRRQLGNDSEFAIAKLDDYEDEKNVIILKEFQVEKQSEAIAYFLGFADALKADVLVALNEIRTMVACIK